MEYYCYQNMLGHLRLILMAEKYYEIDMEDAHCQILTGLYPTAPAINRYHTSRKKIRQELRDISGVSEYYAKELFIRIFFGGSIETWKKDNNISIETTLPPFVYDLEREISEIQSKFLNNGDNIQFINAAKYKKNQAKKSYENSAFALWLQHLESLCMIECMEYFKQKIVEYSALRHDGILVHKDFMSKFDLKELSAYVREKTKIKCSFAAKLQEIDKDALEYKTLIEKSVEEMEFVRKKAKLSRSQDTKNVVEAAIEGGHHLLAAIFHSLFPDKYAFLGKKEGWYEFKQPRWRSLGCDTSDIVRVVDNDLKSFVKKSLAELEKEDPSCDPDIKAVSEMVKNIANYTFKSLLIRNMESLYKIEFSTEWIQSLDINTNVLGFDDCVYDVIDKTFREGRPIDMITLSTGHKREDIENCDETIGQRIIEALRAIHGTEEVFSFVMKVIASAISGDRIDDRVQIWTGPGGNGKGITKTAISSAFGQYYYEVNSGMFATRSVASSSAPTPELADLHGKRICVQSECEPDDKLRVSLLKQCSGHDVISARRLHKDPISVLCQAIIIILCNEIPGCDDNSGAFARRLEVIFHGMCFVDNPTLPNERQIDKTLNSFLKTKKAGASFLSILIKYFNDFGQVFEVPQSVKNEAKDYIGDNDVLVNFMEKYFEKTGDQSDTILLEDVWMTLTQDPTYKADMNIKRSRDLNQKMKIKQIPTKRSNKGICIIGYKMKQPNEEDRFAEVFE
jgi:P4 family phage/plasmid primase-like protien